MTTFGLASGPVAVGNVGARNRLNYTVMGNTVNLASRCVGLGRDLGCSVLTSESVASATGKRVEWRKLGLVRVKGISRPMMVCEPLGKREDVLSETLAFRDRYEDALERFLANDFDGAQIVLEQLLSKHPGERSVDYLLRRCAELKRRGTAVNTEMLVLG